MKAAGMARLNSPTRAPSEAKPSSHMAAALEGSQLLRTAPTIETAIRGETAAGIISRSAALIKASGASMRPVADPARTR